jgi:hypothetical protein
MLSRAISFLLCACVLGGCSGSPVIKYTCVYGVGWMTAKDYQIISDPAQISDKFADWLLKTNMYCEANDV